LENSRKQDVGHLLRVAIVPNLCGGLRRAQRLGKGLLALFDAGPVANLC